MCGSVSCVYVMRQFVSCMGTQPGCDGPQAMRWGDLSCLLSSRPFSSPTTLANTHQHQQPQRLTACTILRMPVHVCSRACTGKVLQSLTMYTIYTCRASVKQGCCCHVLGVASREPECCCCLCVKCAAPPRPPAMRGCPHVWLRVRVCFAFQRRPRRVC